MVDTWNLTNQAVGRATLYSAERIDLGIEVTSVLCFAIIVCVDLSIYYF